MNTHKCAVCDEVYEYDEDVDCPEMCEPCWAKQYFDIEPGPTEHQTHHQTGATR